MTKEINIKQIVSDAVENDNMTEQHYVELANQFKEILDEKENLIKELKKNLIIFKKEIIGSFGILKILDNLFKHNECVNQLSIITECHYEYLAELIEEML